MKLAIAIARRVLYREIATDPEAILGSGEGGIRQIERPRNASTARLSLRRGRDSGTSRETADPAGDWKSRPMASLTPGSAIFETSRGDLDASVETQLAEIDRGLTDALKRRK